MTQKKPLNPRTITPRDQPEHLILPECPTILRLRNIKRGELIQYYVGHLDEDISRAEGISEAPNYAKLLCRIRSLTYALRLSGKIVTHEQRYSLSVNGPTVLRYFAEGV